MPRKPLRQRFSKPTIPPALICFFKTGDEDQSEFQPEDRYNVFLTFCDRGNGRDLHDMWELCRDNVLSDWLKKNPCTRPFYWWKVEAPERRQQIGGAGDRESLGCRIGADGLPMYWQYDWKSNDSPLFESQAAYLERHELLTPAEKRYLAKHSDLLQPERIEFENNENDEGS